MTKEAWKDQEDHDSLLVITDNMTVFCRYNNNGTPYMTLAGIAKRANEKGVDVKEFNVEDAGTYYVGQCQVHHEDVGNRFGGHSEPKRTVNGQEDPYAYAKCVSKTLRNGFKMILYGDEEIEKMLDDFVKDNKFEPPKKKPPAQKTSKQTKPPEQKSEPAEKSTEQHSAQPFEKKEASEERQPIEVDSELEEIVGECRALIKKESGNIKKMSVGGRTVENAMAYLFKTYDFTTLTQEHWSDLKDWMNEDEYGTLGKYLKGEFADDENERLETAAKNAASSTAERVKKENESK